MQSFCCRVYTEHEQDEQEQAFAGLHLMKCVPKREESENEFPKYIKCHDIETQL